MPPNYLQLMTHAEEGGSDLETALVGSSLTTLTTICRQLHAETRLLLFQHGTFHFHSDGSVAKFLGTLSEAQRDAITTVQISTQDANVGAVLCHSVTHFPGSDFTSQNVHLDLLEWSHNLALDQLPGLKRVLVEKDSQWNYWDAGGPDLRVGVDFCIMGRDIDVVIPPSVPQPQFQLEVLE